MTKSKEYLKRNMSHFIDLDHKDLPSEPITIVSPLAG